MHFSFLIPVDLVYGSCCDMTDFEVEVYYVTSWVELLKTMHACYTNLWSRGALGALKPTFQSPVLTGFRRSRFCLTSG